MCSGWTDFTLTRWAKGETALGTAPSVHRLARYSELSVSGKGGIVTGKWGDGQGYNASLSFSVVKYLCKNTPQKYFSTLKYCLLKYLTPMHTNDTHMCMHTHNHMHRHTGAEKREMKRKRIVEQANVMQCMHLLQHNTHTRIFSYRLVSSWTLQLKITQYHNVLTKHTCFILKTE